MNTILQPVHLSLFNTPTLGKSSVSELRFSLNITTVIDNIIKKGINYLLRNEKSTAKSVYYLHSPSVNGRRHSLKLTLTFQMQNFFPDRSSALLCEVVQC